MQLGRSSSSVVQRGLRVGKFGTREQLGGSLQELLSSLAAAHNNTHQHHDEQQQAWLPLHTASDRLARDLKQTARRVCQALAQANSRSSSSSSPLLRCQHHHQQQQLHPLIATSPVRHAHSSSSSSSGRKVGRSHRPLFSPRRSSRQQPAAAAAMAAAADSEDDDAAFTESDAENQQQQQQAPPSPLDLRNPERAYPIARAMAPRQLTAHLGPTNSGKTHAALAALAAAPTGVYCGPLRLLACEVADRLNAMGVPCNLVTGQEVRRVKGARHTACTVEMADLTTPVDVGVLDEVQMLGDTGRGWSWTRVLLGMPAAELHLCGDPAAAELLERLASDCGDTLSIQRYRRLAPLVVEPEALSGLHEIRDGDCVVAFGRKTLHKLRRSILMHMLPNTQQAAAGSAANAASDSDTSTDTDDSDYAAATEPPGWYSNSCSSSSDDDDTRRADVRDERRQQQDQQQQQQQQQQQEAATARAFQGVGMVYGALPPESRRTQAALFNARGDVWPRSSVLVASDAIGMGLNLNIRRIVFTTLHKYDGVETRPLSASEIKQIAGRAGRYASGHAEGYVSVLNPDDLCLLREALATATPQVTHACLLPRYEQLEQYALDHMAVVQHMSHSQRHSTTSSTTSSNALGFGAPLGRHRQQPPRPLSMHKLLKIFIREAQLSRAYVLADMKNMIQLAKLLRHLEPLLSRADMYTLCISPASADDGPVVQALLHLASSYVYDRHVTPDCLPIRCPDQPPRSPAEMKTAEEVFRVFDLWLWLANDRLGSPGVFKGRREVEEQRQQVARLIDVALQRMGGVADRE